MDPKDQPLAAFLREHRSNEANFEKLAAKLDETPGLPNGEAIAEKAEAYRKARETGGTAWPEFEKFVSEFERAVVGVGK